jgi:hypothetical protein
MAHPLFILMAIMPLQWMKFASIGPFSVAPPYLAALLALAFAASAQAQRRSSWLFLKANAYWIVPFLFYLLLLWLALQGSRATNMAPRQAVYLAVAVAFGAGLAIAPRVRTLLRWGGLAGIILFVGMIEIEARKLGLSWGPAVAQFVQSGDLDYMVYSFFRAAFNASNPGGEITIVASAKNEPAVWLLIAAILYRAAWDRPEPDRAGQLLFLAVIFLLICLNTRSVLLAAAGSAGVATVLRVGIAARPGKGAWLLGALLFGLAVTAASWIISTGTPLLSTLQDRFAFDDTSSGTRLLQYSGAMERIEPAFFTGSGFAEVEGQTVHNLFLSAWMHAGLPAFALVLLTIGGLVAAWIATTLRMLRHPQDWVLPLRFGWVSALPLLAFFRIWLSGDAGHLFMGEWLALGAYQGLLLRNASMLTR